MFSRRNLVLFALTHAAARKGGELARRQTEAELQSDPAVRNRAMAALERIAGHAITEPESQAGGSGGPPPPPTARPAAPPPPPGAKAPTPPPPPPPPGLADRPVTAEPVAGAPADAQERDAQDADAQDDESARLLLLAMVRAAQADNRIEQEEKDAIFAKLAEAGLTQRDQWFVEDQLRKSQTLEDWAPSVSSDLAGEVYAVSLATMGRPNLAERRYLAKLAEHLHLDKSRIDQLTEQFLSQSE